MATLVEASDEEAADEVPGPCTNLTVKNEPSLGASRLKAIKCGGGDTNLAVKCEPPPQAAR